MNNEALKKKRAVMKKVTIATLSLSILMGGVLTNMQTQTAEAAGKQQESSSVKGKNYLFETGVINSFKDYNVKIGDHTIHYEMRKGKANPDRTFMLSHGAFSSGEVMNVLATELANKYPNSRIIIVDVPWHGQSTGPADQLKDADVHTYTDVLYDFTQQLKSEDVIEGKFHWIGWSMGGSIGMLLDLKGAGIDELTLLNSSPVWDSLQGLIDFVPEATNVDTITGFYKSILTGDLATNVTNKEKEAVLSHFDAITASPEAMVNDVFAVSPANYDIRDQLKDIKAKTLILSGLNDPMAEVKYQHVLDEGIENSKLQMYDDNHLMLAKPTLVKSIVGDMVQNFGK